MPKIQINDIEIYYEEQGKGYPLVLISGIGGNTMSWKSVLNVLSRYFRVITFDNRGAGQSSAPLEPYSISQMADDLYGLMEYLNLKTAHVVGHSMGGFIAQELALKYSEKVKKLALCCAGSSFTKRNKQLFSNMYKLWESGMSRELWFRELYCWVFSPKFFEEEGTVEFVIQFALEYPYQQSLAGFKGQLEACSSHNTTERLKNIYHETLVLAGKDDILITPDESRTMKDRIANSKMTVIEGSGHTPHLEAKSDFIKILLEFLL